MPNRLLKKQLSLVGILFLFSVWVLFQLDLRQSDVLVLPPPHFLQEVPTQSGFLVNTKGCRIQEQDPFDESVKKFIFDEEVIACDPNGRPPLVGSNLTWLYIEEEAIPKYKLDDPSALRCCYRPFWRVQAQPAESYNKAVDTTYEYSEKCTQFTDGAAAPAEDFVRVECYVNDTQIYTDFVAFFHPNDNQTEGAFRINQNGSEHRRLSVLILGVDAVSRLNFHRQMPKTGAFLRERLDAVEMLGYNKVEDNTFPNLVPVLTGLTENELKKGCWPTTSSVFDDCHFLWKDYKNAGYSTAYGEDASWMGIFNYMKNGFHVQPTDFYLQIFNHVAEKELGHEKKLNANLCIGTRLNLDVLLDAVAKYAIATRERLSFGFFWGGSLSHDFLNLPKLGDNSHVALFEKLLEAGLFETSAVILMSDHGIRWGGIRETYQGYLEERLPFLFISLPDWFRKAYPVAYSYLRNNRLKLTTPFDLHETLKDLIDLKVLETPAVRKRSEALASMKEKPRGQSLFLPVSDERTCRNADISDHWCTCHQSEPLPVNSTNVNKSVAALLGHINSMLEPHTQCAHLSLDRVHRARLEVPTSHLEKEPDKIAVKDYTVTVETVPGNGLFEATLRHDNARGSFNVVGTISRINTYGNQSSCISHYKLKLYCFCNSR